VKTISQHRSGLGGWSLLSKNKDFETPDSRCEFWPETRRDKRPSREGRKGIARKQEGELNKGKIRSARFQALKKIPASGENAAFRVKGVVPNRLGKKGQKHARLKARLA